MHWVYLAIAIVLEVAGTTCMKMSEGFTKPWYSVAMFALYALAFTALTLAIKKLDVSVAYAIWAGAGTALIAMIGLVAFDEKLTALKVVCLILIIVGVVGLNLQTKHG